MIKNREPMSMAESLDYIHDSKEDSEADMKKFIKKFVDLKPEKAKEIREKIDALALVKLRPESVVKIIDVMPDNKEDLNKIFVDVNLDEDETKKILDTLGEFR